MHMVLMFTVLPGKYMMSHIQLLPMMSLVLD